MTASAGKTGGLAYLPALDGWRAVSILLVVLSHGGLGHIVPGGLGVTLFFFISGFLITSLLLDEHARAGSIGLKNFYLRRFWRLSPALLMYILLSTLCLIAINGSVDWREPLAAIFYFANYFGLYWHFEALPFAPSPLKIVWSLAVEEHYYILFAPLVCLYAHTRQRLGRTLLLLLVLPLLLRLGIIFAPELLPRPEGYTYAATETRIDSIAWGALLAWLRHAWPGFTAQAASAGVPTAAPAAGRRAAACVRCLSRWPAVCLALAILLFCLVYRSEAFRETLRYTLQGIALLSLFQASLYGAAFAPLRQWLSSAPAVLIGRLSYSIYLYHWLALAIAYGVAGEDALSLPWQATYYALTGLFSWASYRFVETPCLALRKRYGSHANA